MATVTDDRTGPAGEALPAAAAQLRDAIATRTARVGIIGLGYVGLPLGVANKPDIVTNRKAVDHWRVAQRARTMVDTRSCLGRFNQTYVAAE
jgi:hypothetical protein